MTVMVMTSSPISWMSADPSRGLLKNLRPMTDHTIITTTKARVAAPTQPIGR